MTYSVLCLVILLVCFGGREYLTCEIFPYLSLLYSFMYRIVHRPS